MMTTHNNSHKGIRPNLCTSSKHPW